MQTLPNTITLRRLRTVRAPAVQLRAGPARSNAPAENVLFPNPSRAECVALLEQSKGMAEDGSVCMVFLKSQQDVFHPFGPRQKDVVPVSPDLIGNEIAPLERQRLPSNQLDVGLEICMAENHYAYVMLQSTPTGQVGD
jgi:hypothetical protein